MKKTALILNIAPYYRKGIYSLMDKCESVHYDFYIGDYSSENIRLLSATSLAHNKKTLKNIYHGKKLVWQKGWSAVFGKQYDSYILTGNPGIKSNWLIMLISKLLRRKVYLWGHGWYGTEKGLKAFVNYTYLKLASGIFLYGDRAKELLLSKGYPASKLTVVYNSLDYDFNLSLRGKFVGNNLFMRNYFGNESINMVFIGRLTERKKIDMIINAMQILKSMGLETNFTLVGDGDKRVELEQLAQEAQLVDNIWFYGECYDETQIANILQNSDICVSPGDVGLTAIHSLSMGVPVITHDNFAEQMPECEAIINEVTGSFFKQNDVNDLVVKIIFWINRLKDASFKDNTRQACYNTIDQKYNPHIQIELINKTINHEKN